MAAVVAPLLHKYVPPPAAVKVVLPPLQITDVPVMFAIGNGLTVTVLVAVDVQPLALVTVTVYVASAVGLTGIVAVVAPVFHKYVPPPVAVKFVLPPLQITFVPVIFAIGKAFTATPLLAVAVQPLAFVTVTVYVAFAVGLTVMAAVVSPVFHKYVPLPAAVKVVLPPLQIVAMPVMLAVGLGLTVIVTGVTGPVQPFEIGVIFMVATTGVTPAFTVVNEAIVPEPLPIKPIAVLLFVQLYVTPDVLSVIISDKSPAHFT
jgi:hypothetical protein